MKPTQPLFFVIFLWLSAIIAMVILSLTPEAAPSQQYHLDKWVHAGAFFGLTMSILFFIKRLFLTLWIVAFMLCIGGMIEYMQSYIPHRSGTWGDVAADAVGILLAFLAARFYHRRQRK